MRKRCKSWLWLGVFLTLGGSNGAFGEDPKQAPVQVPYDYKIGEGDVLKVDVFKEPDASAAGVLVRPDGKVTLPFVGEVLVAGLTPTEAMKTIAEKLSK